MAAVAGLDRSLRSLGGSLHVVAGDPAELVPRVAEQIGAVAVVANSDVTRWSGRRDREVMNRLDRPLETHWGTLVQPPGSVLTTSGKTSQVFTPFYRRWLEQPLAAEARPEPASILEAPSGMALADAGFDLLPAWTEQQAREALARWLERVDSYHEDRDYPALEGTSNLSSEMRFGLLSPREIVATVDEQTPGGRAFVRQLAWRDWFAHLSFERRNLDRVAFRPEYDRIEWASGPEADAAFEAWLRGQTGYPIVDAAMRELGTTGRMHNRLRMLAASFLVKDLVIDWRRGERWFRRMLVDGDIPQNAGNWQWVAGTGPDAAPYFRVFNPVTQSRRFDTEGDYLRRWLPELARLDSKSIHAPWSAGPLELEAAGVSLGTTYPLPIVEHAEARKRALDAYRRALDRG